MPARAAPSASRPPSAKTPPPSRPPSVQSLPPGAALPAPLLAVIAERFKVLSEPTRLELLNALRAGERTVSQLMAATGLRQANVSKHLQQLFAAGFVGRRKEGLHVYYYIADQGVFALCHLVCGRLEAETSQRQAWLADR